MKKQELPTRRRSALRRLAMAAVLLALANGVLHVGYLLPVQALRDIEERQGTGKTAVVTGQWGKELYKAHRMYLSAGENVTMLSDVHLSPLGWTSGFGTAVDCTDEAAVHAGWTEMTWQDQETVLYVFGRVDDPDVVRVRAGIQRTAEGAARYVLETETFLEQGGYRYFLLRKYPAGWNGHVSLTAYDEAGGVLFHTDGLDTYSSSVYGLDKNTD